MKLIHKIIITTMAAVSGPAIAFAGTNETIVANASVKKDKNTVVVSFDANIEKLNSNYMLVITPALISGDHSHTLALNSRVFTGRNKRLVEMRKGNPVGSYIRVSKRDSNYRYSVSVPYEDWMANVDLVINQRLEGCCDTKELASGVALRNVLLHYAITPYYDPDPQPLQPADRIEKALDSFTFVHPMSMYADRYDRLKIENRAGNNMYVFFERNHTGIDPSFRNNAATLDRINKALDIIDNTPGLTLEKILIAGFASPEGSLDKNVKLAESRMNELKRYLSGRSNYSNYQFELFNGQEDWDGLKYYVERSDMKHRKEVIDIIDNIPVLNGREKKLMELGGGEPYRYMLNNFFPDLRNAGYVQVYYGKTESLDSKTIEQNERTDILNQATEMANRQDYASALSLLQRIADDPRAFNLIGVCYMMTGEYDKAESMFMKSVQNGDIYAPKNREELIKARQVN